LPGLFFSVALRVSLCVILPAAPCPDASFPFTDTFHGYVLRAEDVAVGGLMWPGRLTHGLWAHRGVFRGRSVLVLVRCKGMCAMQAHPTCRAPLPRSSLVSLCHLFRSPSLRAQAWQPAAHPTASRFWWRKPLGLWRRVLAAPRALQLAPLATRHPLP
jgi:hypothetical protein